MDQITIEWTNIAWRDLEETVDYIAIDSQRNAEQFAQRVRQASRDLAIFPTRGRMVPEFDRSDVREIPIGPYRLIYHLKEPVVYIIAFIHGARDLGPLWERERRERIE